MNYKKIYNPETQRFVSIHSKLGRKIVGNYMTVSNQYMSGGNKCGCCTTTDIVDQSAGADAMIKCAVGDKGRCKKSDHDDGQCYVTPKGRCAIKKEGVAEKKKPVVKIKKKIVIGEQPVADQDDGIKCSIGKSGRCKKGDVHDDRCYITNKGRCALKSNRIEKKKDGAYRRDRHAEVNPLPPAEPQLKNAVELHGIHRDVEEPHPAAAAEHHQLPPAEPHHEDIFHRKHERVTPRWRGWHDEYHIDEIDTSVDGWYSLDQLSNNQKFEDLVKLLHPVKLGARDMGKVFDPHHQLANVLQQIVIIITQKDDILHDLEGLPLGDKREAGRVVYRGLLDPGTQLYNFSRTIQMLTDGKVLHTENAIEIVNNAGSDDVADYPAIILNMAERAFSALYESVFLKHTDQGYQINTMAERTHTMDSYYPELVSPFRNGCFEVILNTWLEVVSKGDAFSLDVDPNDTFYTNMGRMLENLMDYLCRQAISLDRRTVFTGHRPDVIHEQDSIEKRVVPATNYVFRMLNNIDGFRDDSKKEDLVIDLFRQQGVFGKRTSDGIMTEKAVREYLVDYVIENYDDDAIKQRCGKKFWGL